MSVFIAMLARMIQSRIGQWAMLILASLGLGLATHTAVMGPALDGLLSYMQGLTSGGGEYLSVGVQMLAYTNFDKAVTMVVSAYGARAGIRAAKAFLVKKA